MPDIVITLPTHIVVPGWVPWAVIGIAIHFLGGIPLTLYWRLRYGDWDVAWMLLGVLTLPNAFWDWPKLIHEIDALRERDKGK